MVPNYLITRLFSLFSGLLSRPFYGLIVSSAFGQVVKILSSTCRLTRGRRFGLVRFARTHPVDVVVLDGAEDKNGQFDFKN